MNKCFLGLIIVFMSYFGYSQTINQYGSISTDSFPEVSFYINVYAQNEPDINDFKLTEASKDVDFDISKAVQPKQDKSKTVLILFEDMSHKVHDGQKKFFQKLLQKSLPEFVKKGDKINIAIFDRNRDGESPYRYLLDNYTDNVDSLIDAVNNFESVIDYHSKNKGSNIYNAVYSGLTELNKDYKDKNKLILLLTAGYNYSATTDNTQESIIQYAKEKKTPIYVINYLIWENRTLNRMALESYGLNFNTSTKRDNLDEATDSTISFMNKAVTRLLGYNYKIEYNTSYERDGANHLAVLTYGNIVKELNFTFPKCDIKCLVEEHLYISIGIAVGIILIIITIILIVLKKKKKRKLLNLEKEKKHKQELEKQRIAQQQTEAKLADIEKKKELERKQKEEAEQKGINRQILINEIKSDKGFPLLSVTLGNDNYEYKMDTPEITVGREADNDLYISNPSISRKHFKISYRTRRFFIKDLGSTNGTIINGRMITTEEELNNNDIIQVGPIKIVFIW